MWPESEPHNLNHDSVTSLKLAINNLVWMHGPADMTLTEAEALALDVLVAAVRHIEQATGNAPAEPASD